MEYDLNKHKYDIQRQTQAIWINKIITNNNDNNNTTTTKPTTTIDRITNQATTNRMCSKKIIKTK